MEINAGKILGSLLSEGSGGNAAAPNIEGLGELVTAIQNTKVLDAEKLASLKSGLLDLAKGEGVPADVKLKLTPLLAALKSADAGQDTARAWDALKPFLSDADSLSKLTGLLGEYGGQALALLKKVFLHQ